MSELGRRLKEEREKKQLSLEDIQKETKIQKRYLIAIEEGNFDILPGKFYARAFVKNYAESVGLDPEQLFDELGKEIPNPTNEVAETPSRMERPKPKSVDRKDRRKNSFITALIGFVGVVIVLIGIYVVVQFFTTDDTTGITPDEQDGALEGEFSDDLPEEEPNEPVVEEEPVTEEEEPVVEATQQLQFIESRGNNSIFELSGTDQFVATMEYTGRSYVGIKNAIGKNFLSEEATAGASHEFDFSAETEIEFNFGASQFVQLEINGELIDFPLDVVHQRITIKFQAEE